MHCSWYVWEYLILFEMCMNVSEQNLTIWIIPLRILSFKASSADLTNLDLGRASASPKSPHPFIRSQEYQAANNEIIRWGFWAGLKPRRWRSNSQTSWRRRRGQRANQARGTRRREPGIEPESSPALQSLQEPSSSRPAEVMRASWTASALPQQSTQPSTGNPSLQQKRIAFEYLYIRAGMCTLRLYLTRARRGCTQTAFTHWN